MPGPTRLRTAAATLSSKIPGWYYHHSSISPAAAVTPTRCLLLAPPPLLALAPLSAPACTARTTVVRLLEAPACFARRLKE
jgi:hypothetical protein